MKNSQIELTIEEQIAQAKEQLVALKAQAKELNKKEKAPKKGVPVRFTNKKGVTIEGLGVLYYCVTLNGVTHLKQVDSVEVL